MVRQICIVFLGLSDIKSSDKIMPLHNSGLFDEIHVVRDNPGVEIPGVVFYPTPKFLSQFFIFCFIFRLFQGLIISYNNRRFTITIISYYCIPHGVIAYLVSRVSGNRLVTCLIGDDINIGLKSSIFKPFILLVCKASYRIVVTGSTSARVLYFFGFKQVRIVRNTIDTKNFRPVKEGIIQKTSLIVIGELTKNKRIDRTIKLVKELHQRGVYINCTIVGSGIEYFNLLHLVSDLGLQNWIQFTEYRKDIPEIIRTHVALCLFSENEGFPSVIAESVCSGTPVLTIGVGDIPDIIEVSSPLIIYHPQWNLQFFADALEKLLSTPISKSDRLIEASKFHYLFSYVNGGNQWLRAMTE